MAKQMTDDEVLEFAAVLASSILERLMLRGEEPETAVVILALAKDALDRSLAFMVRAPGMEAEVAKTVRADERIQRLIAKSLADHEVVAQEVRDQLGIPAAPKS